MSVENVDDSVWLSVSMTGGTHPDTAGTSDTGLHIHTHTCTVQQRVRHHSTIANRPHHCRVLFVITIIDSGLN